MQEEDKKYCNCGCGEEVKNKWVRGHHSRVNNISKRADIREKRRVSMKKRHEDGVMPDPWNKGKTKEDDKRLKKQGKTWKENLTTEMRVKYSDHMKKQWEDGDLKPLCGKDHSNWKGGTSAVVNRIRGSGRLYKTWKRPILVRDSFACTICKTTGNLAVHHDKERMCEIIKKFIPEDKHEMSWDEETLVVRQVESYHVENNVSGLTLCRKCHDLEHS